MASVSRKSLAARGASLISRPPSSSPKSGDDPVRPRDPHQVIEHRFELLPDHGLRLAIDHDVVRPRQREQMSIKVRRVAVIVRRLLEIDAVRAHLFRRLIEQYSQPQVAPSFGAVQSPAAPVPR